MKIPIKLIFFFFFFTGISSAELIKPNSNLKPFEVLMIQLNSLKNNNNPYKDAGIEQTWEFAHPNNKKITGPLSKFKKIIYSESYKILISHINSEIIILKETRDISVYKVIVLTKSKEKYFFIWQVEKILIEGDLKNCWMTTSVSNSKYIGEVI
tara:strand:+ start:869 stop:1330 length:462 start_codon:yes stop_codon:yes gene_type:complete